MHLQAKEKREELREAAHEAVVRVFQGNTVYQRFREVVLRGRAAVAKRRQAVANLLPNRKGYAHARNLEQLAGKDTALHNLLRSAALAAVGGASRFFMLHLNNTQVQGAEHLYKALQHRKPGQALITVSNHVAAMDDPLVSAAIVPSELIFNRDQLRWTLCATDRCFKNPVVSTFFRTVKVLPVERGAGLEQAGMQVAYSKVQKGDWVHIFPEGKRSEDGRIGKVKRGIGRMVAAADIPPVVVPFIHAGMENVMPKGSMFPRTGNTVKVIVGEPIPVDDLLWNYSQGIASEEELVRGVTNRVEFAMCNLRAKLEDRSLDLPAAETVSSTNRQLRRYDVRTSWQSRGRAVVPTGGWSTMAALHAAREAVGSLPDLVQEGAIRRASQRMLDRHFAQSTSLLSHTSLG